LSSCLIRREITMLPDLSLQLIVFLLCVATYTVVTAVWDLRVKRIPNKVTVPMFCLGLVYQGVFNQFDGLLEGLGGFGIGFGFLLVVWLIGSGGGGDVKLMGGLGVWLGTKLTLYVIVTATLFAAMGTILALIVAASRGGLYKTKDQYLGTGKVRKGQKPRRETIEHKQKRRALPFAFPVALATWLIVAWQLPTFPWMESDGDPVAAAAIPDSAENSQSR
jgi:prepilin peptidase CpaA